MEHAREDYNRIQDPEGKIPENEPVFLLRGQDWCSPFVLMDYAKQALIAGADDDIILKTVQHALKMRHYQRRRPNRCKTPDLPKEQ